MRKEDIKQLDKNLKGIYLLVCENEMLYVGQAKSIRSRLPEHYKTKDVKEFYVLYEISEEDPKKLKRLLDLYECYFIELFNTYKDNGKGINKTKGNYKNSSYTIYGKYNDKSTFDSIKLIDIIFGKPEIKDKDSLKYIDSSDSTVNKVKLFCKAHNYDIEKLFEASFKTYLVDNNDNIIKDKEFVKNKKFNDMIKAYRKIKNRNNYLEYRRVYNSIMYEFYNWNFYNDLFAEDKIYKGSKRDKVLYDYYKEFENHYFYFSRTIGYIKYIDTKNIKRLYFNILLENYNKLRNELYNAGNKSISKTLDLYVEEINRRIKTIIDSNGKRNKQNLRNEMLMNDIEFQNILKSNKINWIEKIPTKELLISMLDIYPKKQICNEFELSYYGLNKLLNEYKIS